MRILITGGAGFIGGHLAAHLIQNNYEVYGVDNYSTYYSPHLKHLRVHELWGGYKELLENIDIANLEDLTKHLERIRPHVIIHLAAQAGVRLPFSDSQTYVKANVSGFLNIFLACKASNINPKALLYASSSSVYGDNSPVPYSEKETVLAPKSIYGATKLSNEIMAPVMASELGLRIRGLRFFTVYGEWGRPDMSYFRLGGAALNVVPFKLFGDGSIQRDFTYISDVVENIERLMLELCERPVGFHDVVNVGGGRPLSMNYLIETIEKEFHTKLDLQKKGTISVDSLRTMASTEYLKTLVGKLSFTPLELGIKKLHRWFKNQNVIANVKTWIESSL